MIDKNPFPYTQDPLWNRIEQHNFDDPQAVHPFSKKLAAEQNWSPQFTTDAIAEYRKFMYLCCISPQGASPPQAVDEVWHLHLTYTRDYWQRFCRDTLGREVHHHPSRGGPEEKERHLLWYAATLTLYESTFGHAAPQHIWPPPAPPPTIPVTQFQFFEAGPRKRFLLLLIPFILITLLFWQPIPFLLKGPQFLLFYASLIVTAAFTVRSSLIAKRQLLADVLKPLAPNISKYHLAYLAGGKQRLALLCIADLIATGHIQQLGRNRYGPDTPVADSCNPLLPQIQELLQKEEFTLDEMVAHISTLSRDIDDIYWRLRNEYNKAINNITLPLMVFGIGVLRCIQGVAHDRPVGYLVVMLLTVFGATIGILKPQGKMQMAIGRLLQDDPAYTEHLADNTGRKVVVDGTWALAGIYLYSDLRSWYAQYEYSLNSPEGGGADGGGCGSSCGGGGCGGGGCGGCGG